MKIKRYYSSYRAWLRYIRYHLKGYHPIGVKQSVYKKSDIYNKPKLTEEMVDRLTDMVLNQEDGWYQEYKSMMKDYNFLIAERKSNMVCIGKYDKLGYIYDLVNNPQDDYAYGRLMCLHGVPDVEWPENPALLEVQKLANQP